MPQLDFATFPSQVFWITVGFGLFYLAMSNLVLPKIGLVINDRIKYIEGFVSKAAQLKEQADEIRRRSKSLLEDISVQEKVKIENAILVARERFESHKKRVESEYATKCAGSMDKLSVNVSEAFNKLSEEVLVLANDFVKQRITSEAKDIFCKE
ncbi:MAG: hypothetical protein LBI30_00920 [Holosporales bacterium]|jgi:F-type H+-transporting ATPase subunit b|nr:hypothetical protein [Holosporales bacterium]